LERQLQCWNGSHTRWDFSEDIFDGIPQRESMDGQLLK
jgi:hypothetical protein